MCVCVCCTMWTLWMQLQRVCGFHWRRLCLTVVTKKEKRKIWCLLFTSERLTHRCTCCYVSVVVIVWLCDVVCRVDVCTHSRDTHTHKHSRKRETDPPKRVENSSRIVCRIVSADARMRLPRSLNKSTTKRLLLYSSSSSSSSFSPLPFYLDSKRGERRLIDSRASVTRFSSSHL